MLLLMRRGLSVLTLFVFVLAARPMLAQAPRDARVQVTVVDQTGGVVPGATVRLTGLETATQAQTVAPGTTGESGIATLERVTPGRYSITAEFPGFDLGLVRDIRVRAGDSRHVVVLPLPRLEQSVTVVDQTGGVVPGATVRLTGLETATQAQTVAPGTTGESGIATLERVPPGR